MPEMGGHRWKKMWLQVVRSCWDFDHWIPAPKIFEIRVPLENNDRDKAILYILYILTKAIFAEHLGDHAKYHYQLQIPAPKTSGLIYLG